MNRTTAAASVAVLCMLAAGTAAEPVTNRRTPVRFADAKFEAAVRAELHEEFRRLEVLDISANKVVKYVTAGANPLREVVVWWKRPRSIPRSVILRYDGKPALRGPR